MAQLLSSSLLPLMPNRAESSPSLLFTPAVHLTPSSEVPMSAVHTGGAPPAPAADGSVLDPPRRTPVWDVPAFHRQASPRARFRPTLKAVLPASWITSAVCVTTPSRSFASPARQLPNGALPVTVPYVRSRPSLSHSTPASSPVPPWATPTSTVVVRSAVGGAAKSRAPSHTRTRPVRPAVATSASAYVRRGGWGLTGAISMV
mmetsp:Transcript_140144/g.244065  ORF Transcript_140144/g.244065 Transcript_140144/m.244065 type:complete len:203 (-) Transcript_140144:34-642(-)